VSAYLIYDVDIHDAASYGEFMKKVKSVVESFGGKYLVRGGFHEVLEGDMEPMSAGTFRVSRYGSCPASIHK